MGASADRAVRFRQIRDALGTTQPEFAERLNEVARQLGLDPDYTQLNISQRETGRLELDAEDYAVLSSIDPLKWSWEWLAFGRKLTRGTKVAGRAARTGTD
jgi:transcriptional regulator with XRE-family HTH domain